MNWLGPIIYGIDRTTYFNVDTVEIDHAQYLDESPIPETLRVRAFADGYRCLEFTVPASAVEAR
jgi:hypothetical protein